MFLALKGCPRLKIIFVERYLHGISAFFLQIFHSCVIRLIDGNHQLPVLSGHDPVHCGTGFFFFLAAQILHLGPLFKSVQRYAGLIEFFQTIGRKGNQTGIFRRHFHITALPVPFFQSVLVIGNDRIRIGHQFMIDFFFGLVNFRKMIMGKAVAE